MELYRLNDGRLIYELYGFKYLNYEKLFYYYPNQSEDLSHFKLKCPFFKNNLESLERGEVMVGQWHSLFMHDGEFYENIGYSGLHNEIVYQIQKVDYERALIYIVFGCISDGKWDNVEEFRRNNPIPCK